MKLKIALLIIVNIIAMVAYIYFIPDAQAEIALNQFEEGSANIRTSQYIENVFWTLYPLVNLLLIIWIFFNPIKKLFERS